MTIEGEPRPVGGVPHGRDDRSEFAAIRAALARCALALTRSEHDADDLVQETLTRLLERPDLDDPQGYGVTTLTRLWLTRQRRLAAQARRLRAIAAERVPGPPRPAGSLARIERIVAALPARQRAVLVLRAVMGLNTEQIARTLEIDEQAVRSSLHLARQRVRQQAGDQP